MIAHGLWVMELSYSAVACGPQSFLPIQTVPCRRNIAFSALYFNSLTLSLIPCPSLSTMIFLTLFCISSLPTTLFYGKTSNWTTMPNSSVSIVAFIFCSAKSGNAIIGTPFKILSSVEFHPQRDINAPIERWLKMSTCETQSEITNPTFWILDMRCSL